MTGLKDLRNRVKSIKSTQKITKAMQMVAAAKLRKVRDIAVHCSHYSELMNAMTLRVANVIKYTLDTPPLLKGSGKEQAFLLLVLTSDKGLCGAFNYSILRKVRNDIDELIETQKEIEILCLGKKGYEILKYLYPTLSIKKFDLVIKDKPTYDDAKIIKNHILTNFKEEKFDVCKIYFSKFKNTITQVATSKQLIPIHTNEGYPSLAEDRVDFLFEPREEVLLEQLIDDNLLTQFYSFLLENLASEHGARMTAMDNATKNANEMIDALTLKLNRTRQAIITKELIEIISGADAL